MAKIGCACPHCSCEFEEGEAVVKSGKKYCSETCAELCTPDACVCGCAEGGCKHCD